MLNNGTLNESRTWLLARTWHCYFISFNSEHPVGKIRRPGVSRSSDWAPNWLTLREMSSHAISVVLQEEQEPSRKWEK